MTAVKRSLFQVGEPAFQSQLFKIAGVIGKALRRVPFNSVVL